MAKTMGVVTKSDTYWSLIDGRTKYKWDMADSYAAGKEDGMDIGKKDGIELAVKQLAAALGKDESELRKCIKDIE